MREESKRSQQSELKEQEVDGIMSKYEMTTEQVEAYRDNLGLIGWYIKQENSKRGRSHKIDYEDAYDILSDTLIRTIKRHDEKKGKLSTFFYSTARMDMTKYYRKKKREVESVLVDYNIRATGDRSDKLEDRDYMLELESCLSEYEQELLKLLIEKYTSREIAKITGFSKSKVLRDSNKLRSKLERLIGGR